MDEIPLRWRHVTIHSLRSWLHGDGRGFRSRGHRIHSSGDYKNPPPPREHEGLRNYHKNRSGEPVIFSFEARAVIGRAIVRQLLEEGYRVLAVSVSATHAHILVELPDEMQVVHEIIGRAKNQSSRAVRTILPGAIWAEGGDFNPVEDRDHQLRTFEYILHKQGSDAWSWNFREGPPPDEPEKPVEPGKRKRKPRVRKPRVRKSPPDAEQAGAE